MFECEKCNLMVDEVFDVQDSDFDDVYKMCIDCIMKLEEESE